MDKDKVILKYIDELLEKSTPQCPVWNVEKLVQKENADWNYIDGCMIKAILEMYAITNNQKYLDFADNFIDFRVRDDGMINGYNVNELNIDNINAGKTLFELYDLTHKEKYRKAIDLVYSQISLMSRTLEGNFWHKNIYPSQVWLDGLYMCHPFYMEYETRFNNKLNYQDIYRQFEVVKKRLKDARTGLYFHAYDSSKQMFWCDKDSGLSSHFWLRAIGWFAMSLLDTLDKSADINASDNQLLKDMFIDLMDSMCRYQDNSGMWYQIVNLTKMPKNYLETSGSAIMAYALLKGVRLNILDHKYQMNGIKAFNGICDKYLVVENAELHLDGICLVAGLGGKQMRSGTFEYYMSEPIVKDDAKGVGPFLLAYCEILRLK